MIFKNIINFEKINLNFFFFKKKKNVSEFAGITKETARILFVDDERFPIVDNLVSAGWNAKRIKDITNLQDEDIKNSHIIFIDYKGVGKKLTPKEEGMGLIRALRGTYGDNKRVILYSGYTEFPVNIEFELAHSRLAKTSDLYEFIEKIESELKKIK